MPLGQCVRLPLFECLTIDDVASQIEVIADTGVGTLMKCT
jgi:hypothetical protein